MKKGQLILTLTLTVTSASVAWAQGDQPSAPVPAFGQENPAPPVSENPPISGIDQPGLEPHAAPESFLLPGLHFSESVDSNVSNTLGGSSLGSVTRGLGSLTLQKLWKNYDVAMDYIGGVAYYDEQGIGVEQLHQFDIDNRINWKRGQLGIRDSFSYLPEGNFGFSAYGGSGAYNSGLGSLGAGMLGASAFGGQNNAFIGGGGANAVPLGSVPRISNLALADVVESLTPRSSVTASVGVGIVHFYGGSETSITGQPESISFIGSREETAQVGYDRILNARNQVAVSYGYQAFDFSIVGTAFHANILQAMYGHRISGRMDFTISAGPQFTHIDSSAPVCSIPGFPLILCAAFGGTTIAAPETADHVGLAGAISLRYRFPKTTLGIGYQRFNTNGSGVFAGTRSDIVHLDLRRPLSRIWDAFGDVGYSKNSELQLAGSTVAASQFSYTYAGAGLHRQFGPNLRGFVSYQFNYLTFNTSCPVPVAPAGNLTCSNTSQRHVGSIGLDWTPRPIRLD